MDQPDKDVKDYLGDTCRMVGNRGDVAYGCSKLGIMVSTDVSGMGLVRGSFFKASWNIQDDAVAQRDQRQPAPAPQISNNFV